MNSEWQEIVAKVLGKHSEGPAQANAILARCHDDVSVLRRYWRQGMDVTDVCQRLSTLFKVVKEQLQREKAWPMES